MQTLQDLVNSFDSKKDCIANSVMTNQLETETYGKLKDKIINYSKAFLSLGLTPEDKVALISGNNSDWISLCLAINNAGLIDVPRGETTNAYDISNIINHSGAKAVIVENEIVLKKVQKNFHKNIKNIISIKDTQETISLDELLQIGKNSDIKIPRINENEMASIIYTSGTTGNPKGVELTHGNYTANIEQIRQVIPVGKTDKFLSILPPWHVFERMMKYIALDAGAQTFHSTQKTFLKDIQSQDPTIIGSVPRIWQLFYDGVMKKMKREPEWKQSIFSFALNNANASKESNNSIEKIARGSIHEVMDKLILNKIRKGLGNNFRYAISGGGSLPKHVDEFFRNVGLEILEGYGLTETSAALSVRSPNSNYLYNVGPLLNGIEGKILDFETQKIMEKGKEGALHVRGPNLMKGYYKNEKATKEVLSDDGWFNTGDRVYLDKENNLVITGRQKDIIVRSNGENTDPLPLEEKLIKSEYISSAIVTGQDWKLLGAYIVPDFEALEKYCAKEDIPFVTGPLSTILLQDEIQSLYKNEIKNYVNSNPQVQSSDAIRSFAILDKPFEIEKELTPTLKAKRNEIDKIHKKHYESMKDKCN